MSSHSRRKWMKAGLGAAAGVSGLAAVSNIAGRYGLIPPDGGGLYGPGETLTYAAHRLLGRDSMAREFPRSQISAVAFANGTPLQDATYKRHRAEGFAGWQLQIDGMVAKPASLSLAEVKAFPSHSHITHLACEEGWSYIAEWKGVQLSRILEAVGIAPQARYVVYVSHEPGWWDSLDMADALHPQTLIAYGLNGGDLPVGNGGPLRMRVPRQLGYKNVKYITRLTVTDSLKSFGKGLGSAAPEGGYAWYAGI
jgi:DMSO/TMAO reductase YedYZ molybdopterin-dependent catalytic subunit